MAHANSEEFSEMEGWVVRLKDPLGILRSQVLTSLFPVPSQAGDPVGRHHTAGEERHAAPAWCDQSEHEVQWTFLLRLSQHQWDLQVDGAAGEHSHEATLRQWGIWTGQIPAQTEKEVS